VVGVDLSHVTNHVSHLRITVLMQDFLDEMFELLQGDFLVLPRSVSVEDGK
jgi:hypothetical protein